MFKFKFIHNYPFIKTQHSGQRFLISKADKVEYSVKVHIKKQCIMIYIYIPHLASQ